jgi:outer membrane receptor for Fe3+-dicitrate
MVEQMPEVQVRADYDREVAGVFLPDVQGTKIHAGKKTSNIDLEDLPEISMDNFRQAIAKTPGLVLAEESSPLVSIGYRGFNPHRMMFLQVLEDGIPIHADMYGYAESYYTPPLDAVESIEFVRGGAALMYGPQPGGAMNFLMKKPPLDTPFELQSTNIIGSFDLYSNFTSFGGTVGRFGYSGYYDHQETDGFRAANSDFFLNAWGGTFALDATGPLRTYLNVTAYDETHGEPGGTTLAKGPNAVNYDTDRFGTSRFHDRMRISRYAVSLINEWDVSETTLATFRTWWTYYQRFSRRQNGGGFGTLPTGPASRTNQIENQQFYNFGFEPRLSHNWEWLDNTHTFAGGMQFYYNWSPMLQQQGNSPTAMSGTTVNQSNRESVSYSLFAENLFQCGQLSITPGFRLENIWQSVNELVNRSSFQTGAPLQDETLYNFAPLFGLGLEYEFTPEVAVYASAGRGFETPTFSEIAYSSSSGPNFTLAAARSTNAEIGLKGRTDLHRFTLARFSTTTRNEIVVDSSVSGRTYYKNASRTQRDGWEAAWNAALPANLDTTLAYTTLKATYAESFTSSTSTIAAGNVLPGVPASTLYAEVRWKHARSGFSTALEARRNAKIYVNDANSDAAEAYSVGNVRAGFEQTGPGWKMSQTLRIDNVANRRYIGSVIVADSNSRFFESALPRSISLMLSARSTF